MTNLTKAELEAENERLRAELDQLRTERTPGARQLPSTPSFGLSEGERDEIERLGSAVSPFDGKRRTEGDLPEGVTVDESARQREPETGQRIDVSVPPGEQQGDR